MGQLKRRRPAHLLRPGQMLATLGSLRLTALLQHGGIWLAVTPELAELLNQCCTGQMDGGPGTAEEVAAVLRPLGWDPKLPEELQSGGAAAAPAPAGSMGPGMDARGGAQAAGTTPGVGAREEAGAGAGAAESKPAGPTPGPSAGHSDQPTALGSGAGGVDGSAGPNRAAVPDAGRTSDAVGEGAGTSEAGTTSAAAGPATASTAAVVEPATAAAAAAAPADGGGAGAAGRGVGPPAGRGRGRRAGWQPPPPYSPAAAGCPLVAVRLTLEEAFFLAYVLGSLQVYELQPGAPIPATSEHVRQLDTLGLWAACRAVRSNFVTSYVAYHHLKTKGWIPRSGLLYGVDYVVYQLHPVGCHSDFGVLVVPLAPGGRPAGPHTPPLGWLDLQITNRLINQVVKKLILLYEYEQPGVPDHSTPACLSNFLVEERIVRRWVPDATRD